MMRGNRKNINVLLRRLRRRVRLYSIMAIVFPYILLVLMLTIFVITTLSFVINKNEFIVWLELLTLEMVLTIALSCFSFIHFYKKSSKYETYYNRLILKQKNKK